MTMLHNVNELKGFGIGAVDGTLGKIDEGCFDDERSKDMDKANRKALQIYRSGKREDPDERHHPSPRRT
jgi:hypothetical protein